MQYLAAKLNNSFFFFLKCTNLLQTKKDILHVPLETYKMANASMLNVLISVCITYKYTLICCKRIIISVLMQLKIND